MSLPDLNIFFLTPAEAVELDEELMEEARKMFPLAPMNSREAQKAIVWAVNTSGHVGGWYWQTETPGCLPDGDPIGPFSTPDDALADAREVNSHFLPEEEV